MTNSALIEGLRRRFGEVEDRIATACARSGRVRDDVRLIAVTKTIAVEVAALLPELNVLHLGESRPQELWKKAEAISTARHWHLIGHLQRNKIERTLRINPLIHSVDSLPLLRAIEKEAVKQSKEVNVLLEVNASGEPNKHGFTPEAVPQVVRELPELRQVRIHGLMTMAAYSVDAERCRPTFALLRELAISLRNAVKAPHRLTELSMGMSNDFEVAIEEGTTWVRIGTALFEGIV